MPSESDSPIERQLRDYAERRRSTASEDQFKIHPVTRNSLKVEIVKKYGRRLPGQEKERSGWSVFWPKLAFAGAGLAILIVALNVFQPFTGREQQRDVALNESSDPPELPVAAEPTTQSDGFVPSETLGGQADADARSEVVHQFSRSPRSVSLPASAPPAAVRSRSIIPTSANKEPEPRSNASREQRDPAPTATSAAPNAVGDAQILLQSFQFIMNGDRVTVVDQDNSRYLGFIQPINPDMIASGGAFGPPSLGDATDPDFPRKYRLYSESGGRTGRMAAGQFTVRGVNVTLGKEIQFTGRMLTWTQAVTTTEPSISAGPSSILQIQGTATSDGGTPVQVDATTSTE